MNHFEYNDMFREYIPKLVKYHKFSFESALVPEPPRPTYPSYRHGYSQHRTHWRPPNSAHISGNSWRTGYTYHLLHKALYAKDPNSAAEMMEGILNTSLPQIPIAEQDSLIISLTKQIRHDLGSSKIPANAHPGIPRFFQTIILRHLLSKLGPAPPPSIPGPTNLRLPELKCSEKHNCPDCRSVAIFLVSTSDSTRTWSMPKASRAHLMAELKKYSRSKNINVSDNQPRGRVGTLTLKKVGLAHEEKLRDIERKRSKIEGIIYGFIDYLGEGEWRDRILGSVKQGGPGYTTHMRTEAEKFLKEPFPAANDAADHPHPAPANSALPMAIPVRESASLAFLGYGLVYIRDVNLGRRSGPMSPDHVQKLLSSYKAGLRRAEPENSIRVSIKAFDLVRFVSANSSVYKPPTRELKASEPIPAFPGISNYEGHRFLIEAGNHRLLALDEYLTQVRGANGQFLSEDERNQEGWWLAEIYDAAVLATNPDIYALVRSKDPIASDSHLPHPVTPFTSTRTLPLPSEMHPAAPSTPSASPSTASIPTAIRTAPESAITSQVEARPGSPLAGGQKRAINEIDLTSPEGRPPKKKPWKIIDLIELEDD